MDVSIIGAGYVGLVTGAGLAKAGHNVVLVEKRKDAVAKINRGECPFFEPGLPELLRSGLDAKRISATGELASAVRGSEITMICVGTPQGPGGEADLSQVFTVAREVGAALRGKGGFHLVVVKSTVVPGTTLRAGKEIESASGKRAGRDFGLAMNPEFLREGCAVEDVLRPDRIIIGAEDGKSLKLLRALYAYSDAPVIGVNLQTAELTKYANNAFLALCISYANEMSQLCERLDGVNAYEVMRGVMLDGRLSAGRGKLAGIASYLIPGCGFGGSCFPKDVRALQAFSGSSGSKARLVSAIMEINSAQAGLAVEKVKGKLGGLGGKQVAMLGVAFKPDTDDIRESPALKIIDRLLSAGAKVRAYDPQALPNVQRIYGNKIEFCKSAHEAIRGADCAILVTKWAEFGKIKPADFKRLLKRPVLLDCRGFYDFSEYSRSLDYQLLGLRGR